MSPFERMGLGSILVLHLAIGGGYARLTPLWQVPDEPAHFNHLVQLLDAESGWPVIEPGDYPFERLEALKASRFPAAASIDGIEYEDHQPPAYYLLAALPFRVAGEATADRVRLIRLFGLLLGSLTICLAWRAATLLDRDDPLLALGCAGFAAFLPMQLAMTAAVNNDALANTVSAAAICLALARLNGRLGNRAWVLGGGGLLGLALLSKLTALAPVGASLLAAEVLAGGRVAPIDRAAARHRLAGIVGLAGLIAAPWLLRNARVYGVGDPFGLRAHGRAVACTPFANCQPRSADWIAERGLGDLLWRMLQFGFESFWGVFGWMGVFFDRIFGLPIYGLLALASLLAAIGLSLGLARVWREPTAGLPRARLGLLGASAGATLAAFLGYNLGFVQHQGRYLLPALLPIALAFSLGLRELGRWLARRSGLAERRARQLADGLPIGFALALLGLAWLGLQHYIVPGLG